MSDRALSLLVYGGSKSGKSTLFLSSPAPRLLLDAESAARFLQTRKIHWNPMDGSAPPSHDGTWDTCVVEIDSYDVGVKALEWLKRGQHPFKSVCLDSISEFQVKAQEGVAGRSKLRVQDWGELFNKVAFFGRDMRDLTTHRSNPLEIVYITATERISYSEDAPEQHRPYLQGQVGSQVPFWYDVCGYMYTTQSKNSEGKMVRTRNLLIGDAPNFEAGNRIPTLNDVDAIPNPNLTELLDAVFGPSNN